MKLLGLVIGALITVALLDAGLDALEGRGYRRGYGIAQAEGDAALEKQRGAHAAEEAKRARAAEADAKQAAQQLRSEQARADQLASDLAQEQRDHRAATDQLKGELAHVTELYREALDEPPKQLPACVLTRGFVRVYNAANGIELPDSAIDSSGTAAPAGRSAAADQLPADGVGRRELLDTHLTNAELCRNTRAQLNRLIDLLGPLNQ